MAYWKIYAVYLLCVFTCISFSESFDVDALCAKRCVMGRGGVLCNCNAMHFNGKRSEPSQSLASRLADYKTHGNYLHVPHTWLSPNKLIYYDSLNSHDVQPLKKKGYNVNNDEQVDPSNDLADLKLVNNFGQEFGVKRAKEKMSKYTKNEFDRIDNSLIPGVFLDEKEKENNSDSNDDGTMNTRQEVASTIKQIMSLPMMMPSDSLGTSDFNDEIVDDSNGHDDGGDDVNDDGEEDGNKDNSSNNNKIAPAAEEAGWRQNLKHLQKVMRQVRHIR